MGDVDTDQEKLYLCILKLLENGSNDFKKLQELCKKISVVVPELEVAYDNNGTYMEYTIDQEAKKKLVRENVANLTPVETEGDGSCLFRALSFLCFGHQNRHTELRVRCIIEMAVNKDRYLEDKDLLERSIAEENYIRKIKNEEKSYKLRNLRKKNEEDFTSDVLNTCNPDAFATFWHIQALGIILKRKIENISCSKDETAELKEYIRLKKYIDRTLDPRDLDVHVPLETDKPPLKIMWLLDEKEKHFVPLIPEDSGLGKSLNESEEEDATLPPKESDNANLDDEKAFKPCRTSTPKKLAKDVKKRKGKDSDDERADMNGDNVMNEQDEDSDDSDDEIVDITSGGNVDHVMDKLKKLFDVKYDINTKLKKKYLSIETLKSLTGPYKFADPDKLGILKEGTIKFVARLIQVQFQIKWNTDDGRPERFNFYDFCNVEKYGKKGLGKTAHLKYDPRRAHVFTELYRKRAFFTDKLKIDYDVFCPDVYARVNEHGWVRICFAREECEQVKDFEKHFSWMHPSLRKFVAKADEITLPANSEVVYSSVKEAIQQEFTLYWAVLKDTDFRSGDHLKLHEIGRTQVYVGKANGGIERRWIKDDGSHAKKMMKCAESICKMKESFDVSRLDGIQLVDARLLLAKIRDEEHAVFLIRTFEIEKDLEEGEKNHRKGKRIGTRNENIVRYEDIGDTWTPKKMEFGMNKN